MSSAAVPGLRRFSLKQTLLVLGVLSLLTALLTPEAKNQGGGLSSYSNAAEGSSIAFELAQRMGWHVVRRDTPLDSAAGPTVQVVVGPQEALGRHEVHRLLDNVRRGGGLVFSLESNDEIADSLGIAIRTRGRLLMELDDGSCPRMSRLGTVGVVPPTAYQLVWKRPPPAPVVPLMHAGRRGESAVIAIGFPFGRGRIAVAGGDEVFTNESMRVCDWGADLVVARLWEYVRAGTGDQPLVFDEFHHGHGVHSGSVSAMWTYLSRTASGRFFATLLVAAALLLLAFAPRPIVPREPERIARRSPLEHAEALGRAYSDVGATRTATSRLVNGLRRRVGRIVAAERKADDAGFLATIARRFPSLTPRVALLQRALGSQITPKEFAQLSDTIVEIERVVSSTPPGKA